MLINVASHLYSSRSMASLAVKELPTDIWGNGILNVGFRPLDLSKRKIEMNAQQGREQERTDRGAINVRFAPGRRRRRRRRVGGRDETRKFVSAARPPKIVPPPRKCNACLPACSFLLPEPLLCMHTYSGG